MCREASNAFAPHRFRIRLDIALNRLEIAESGLHRKSQLAIHATLLRFSRIMSPGSSSDPSWSEGEVWKKVGGTWKPLFGDFEERGISIEWHDFQVAGAVEWGHSFHPNSLEICLNFSGAALLQDGAVERKLSTGQVAIYTTRNNEPRAQRLPGSLHRFITIELSPAFLQSQCSGNAELLKGPLQRFVEQVGECPAFLEIRTMSTALLALRAAFLEPGISAAANEAWYLAKTLEALAHTVFLDDEPGELFCHKHQRQNRDRVDRVLYLLERDLENPPTLGLLAKDVQCSTFHLSRIFVEETGMSIPKFIRTKRIERAADLLKSGRMNVTEAAMAVGYSSLSAFNKAFVEQMGCCPGLYPAVKIKGRRTK